MPVAGRPYELREGDLVQVRHTLQHPGHGSLRNGTTAEVAAIDPDARQLDLRLDDDTVVTLTEQQVEEAELRLGYVQHPFLAQGQTTDTTHLIIGERVTREATYVGLTRARQTTDIYAASAPAAELGGDRVQALAERMNRTEPELPSIRSPLAHESAITAATDVGPSAEDGSRGELTRARPERPWRAWPRPPDEAVLDREPGERLERGGDIGWEP